MQRSDGVQPIRVVLLYVLACERPCLPPEVQGRVEEQAKLLAHARADGKKAVTDEIGNGAAAVGLWGSIDLVSVRFICRCALRYDGNWSIALEAQSCSRSSKE